MIIWLATASVTLTGFLPARHELSSPRPTRDFLPSHPGHTAGCATPKYDLAATFSNHEKGHEYVRAKGLAVPFSGASVRRHNGEELARHGLPNGQLCHVRAVDVFHVVSCVSEDRHALEVHAPLSWKLPGRSCLVPLRDASARFGPRCQRRDPKAADKTEQ